MMNASFVHSVEGQGHGEAADALVKSGRVMWSESVVGVAKSLLMK